MSLLTITIIFSVIDAISAGHHHRYVNGVDDSLKAIPQNETSGMDGTHGWGTVPPVQTACSCNQSLCQTGESCYRHNGVCGCFDNSSNPHQAGHLVVGPGGEVRVADYGCYAPPGHYGGSCD